jgi:hypothetical protein
MMIKDVFRALGTATRKLFQNWRALLIMLALYLVVLGSLYLFFSTREATIAQLLLTLALAILVPVLKLIIQTMAVRYSSQGRSGRLLLGSLADFWKLAVIVLPIAIVIGLAVYFLDSIEYKSVQETVRSVAAPRRLAAPRVSTARSTPWQAVALTSLQYLLLGLALPLAAFHLTISAARQGLKNAFQSMGRTLGRAFAPRSVLIYAIGFFVFAVIPYFLVMKRTPIATPWLDVLLLVARLAMAVLFSLLGWVVTVAALASLDSSESIGAAQPDRRQFTREAEHAPTQS